MPKGTQPEEEKVSLWKKLASRDTEWEKDEILEVVYWVKQVVAFVCGIAWGVLKLTGLPWIVSFAVIAGVISYIVGFQYLKAEEADIDGPWPVVTEGGMPCAATFLLAWISTYTILFF